MRPLGPLFHHASKAIAENHAAEDRSAPLGLQLALPPLDAEILSRRHDQVHIVPRLAPADVLDIGALLNRLEAFEY
ncbi:MAG: hypothetical protein ACREYE_19085 [Gammaproteobacteria bacterium]